MDISIRSIGEAELGALSALDSAIFGYSTRPDDAAYLATLFDLSRVLCAFDGGDMAMLRWSPAPWASYIF